MAAALTVASVSSGMALADAPSGLRLPARASPVLQVAPLFSLSHADSRERWSLTADAARVEWATGQSIDSRFQGQGLLKLLSTAQPLDGEARRASLALDWQRRLDVGSWGAGAFATTREVALDAGALPQDEGTMWERVTQRDRGTRLGAHLGWNGSAQWGALGLACALGMRTQADSLDSLGRLDHASGRNGPGYREDRLRQSFTGVDVSTEARWGRSVRATASAGVVRHRYDVVSSVADHSGQREGWIFTPRLELSASLRGGTEYFANVGRLGAAADGGPAVVYDPRNGAPVGRLDPASGSRYAEAGVRGWLAPGLQARLAAWQAKTDAELWLVDAPALRSVERPAVRNGLRLGARYEPLPWLALDLDARALRATYRDGARERVRGAAERHATAGATVRNGTKWRASLFVSYLGARPALEEDALRLRSSTTVGAQFSARLSKSSRVSFDVFNIFNHRTGELDYFAGSRLWSQPGVGDGFLFHPAEPRGLRINFTTRF